MTCIVAAADGTRVWMVGDSASVAPNMTLASPNPKVFCPCTGMLVGFTGSWRIGQIVMSYGRPIKPPVDPYRALIDIFVPWLDDRVKQELPKHEDWELLIGVRGRLFTVDENYAVLEVGKAGGEALTLASVGAGSEIALGALLALVRFGLKPLTDLKIALAITASLCPSVKYDDDTPVLRVP